MKVLSFEEIQAVQDTQDTQEVPIPEWGADAGVIIRRMNREQFLEIKQNSLRIAKDEKGEAEQKVSQELFERWTLINGVVAPPINESRAIQMMQHWMVPVGRIVDAIGTFNQSLNDEAKAQTAAEAEFPRQPGPDVRVSPGAAAGADGEGTAPHD
jgi:hypothetical protein